MLCFDSPTTDGSAATLCRKRKRESGNGGLQGGGGGLVALPLLLVEPHGETEGVYGEGEYNGRTLLRGYCVQGLKKRTTIRGF
jgi:hypothetical protein